MNSTEYPIYIEGYTTSDKKITFNIYGKETRDKNRTISFESQMVSETPATTILQEDADRESDTRRSAAREAPDMWQSFIRS